MKFRNIYPYFPSKSFCVLLFSSVVFLSSCSDNSKLKGEWVRSDYKSTLKITDDKVIFDNITEREYAIKGNTLKVIAYGIAEDYEFSFKGDTLVLSQNSATTNNTNKIQKFIAKDKVSTDEEQLKVLLKPQLEKMFEQKITKIEIKKEHWGDLKQRITLQKAPSIPDEEWTYLAEMDFENEAMPTATIFVRSGRNKAGILQPVWGEILESSTKRYLINGMGIPAEKIELKSTGANAYEATVTTTDGTKLPVLLDPNSGVYPKQDETSIATYLQYSLQKTYGKELIQKVELTAKEVDYTGIITLENNTKLPITYSKLKGVEFGELPIETKKLLAQSMIEKELNVKLEIKEAQEDGALLKMTLETPSKEKLVAFVDVIRGWYPENNPISLSTATRYRIQRKVGEKNKVGSVILAQRSQKKYEGTVDFASGAVQRIIVEHTGTGFSWRVANEQDKYMK